MQGERELLRSLAASHDSHLDFLKRRFDTLNIRDLEASHSRISKRIKTSYNKFVAKMQASTYRASVQDDCP